MPDENDKPASQSPASAGAGVPAPAAAPAPAVAPPQEEVEQWDQDDVADQVGDELVVEKEAVTEQDKFKLAKNILLFAAFIYLGVALVTISVSPDKTEDVWNFSKVALNSLVAVVVGYYFGKK